MLEHCCSLRDFSALHSVQIGSGAHSVSYSKDTEGFASEVKRQGPKVAIHPYLAPG
jgi:hypothetical protein